ncbi:hypothetical protein [Actinoallomurus iriomotensis]|uniref:Uncharacterized protein n=1 Tax=Actinoallomurus iriomotensis TaxID=478107 RepID=A0A9W6SFH8_9ACTN|nr:hypothetical protein [Actinoallomurus iriomotensis]GLY91287.1 hypothetical protein Airi02_092160 [Actinoallomurus iriomotensis]
MADGGLLAGTAAARRVGGLLAGTAATSALADGGLLAGTAATSAFADGGLLAGFAAFGAARPAALSCVDGVEGWCADTPQPASVIPAAATRTMVPTGRLNILTTVFPAISLDGGAVIVRRLRGHPASLQFDLK